MDTYKAIIAAALLSFLFLVGLSMLVQRWRFAKRIRNHLKRDLGSLSDLRGKLRRGLVGWIVLLIVWAVGFVVLAAVAYYYFFANFLQASLDSGFLAAVMSSIRNSGWVLEFPGEEFRAVPLGVISAIVIGGAIGWVIGAWAARKWALNTYHLTSKLA